MKKVIQYLLFVAIVLTVVSCKKQKNSELNKTKNFIPSLDTEREVTLNVLGTYGNFEALEQVFNEFNQFYPKVNLSYEYADNVHQATLNRCASDEDIDIIFFEAVDFNKSYGDINQKYLVDILKTPVDLSAIDKDLISYVTIEDKVPFLPIYLMTTGIMVNENWFKKFNLSLPRTLSEFEAVCDTFVSNGVTPVLACDDFSTMLLYNHLIFEIENHPEKEKLVKDLNDGKVSPELFSGIKETYERWKERGYFDYSANNLPDQYSSLILRFLEGDVPMIVANSDTISGTKKREAKSAAFRDNPFEYTFIPAPTGTIGPECVYTISLFFGLLNTSKELDYATEFLRFMYTENELKTMTYRKGMPSVITQTGDFRIRHFDELKNDEKYYLGQGKLSFQSGQVLSAVIYSVQDSCEKISARFEQIMAHYND